jgi:hypothetical protein
MPKAQFRRPNTSMMFRRLSHTFSVRCDDPGIRDYVSRVLSRFAVAEGGTSDHAYEVVDLGPSQTQSRYRLLVDGRLTLVSGSSGNILADLFAHVNLDTVEATRELVLVHAGAVVAPNGLGMLLPAPSGAGKTTLVAGLIEAGFGYLSDEAAVLDPSTGDLLPYPSHLSLKGKSRDRFRDAMPDRADVRLSDDAWHVDPDAIRPGAVGSRCEVGFVIPHRYEPGADIRVEPLSRAAACVELSRNLMTPRRDAAGTLVVLAEACRTARCYRLTSGDLDGAVEAIAEIAAG